MNLDEAALAKVTAAFRPKAYSRISKFPHTDTPLGTGPGKARFSSINGNFQTLYAAASLATAIAETIVRDRFEGGGARQLFSSELEKHSVAQLSATVPLNLIDLRTDGCFQLGVSTDIASAQGWDQSRKLAQYVYDHTALDGFLYRSRLTGANCIAIFNRAIDAKLTAGKPRPLTAAPGLATALKSLSVEVIL
jgi:RES domain